MLTLITTPIGNLSDMTPRSIAAIEEADLLACEDTRTTAKLIMLLGITTKAQLVAYHDHNGEAMRPRLLNALANNLKVGLLSDAGTPLISDPGYKLVRQARDDGHQVTATAGACAPILALILSGLPSDRFLFHGFFPDKRKTAHALLEECRMINVTSVFFISPSQLENSLAQIYDLWGNRDAALVREISKLHEQVIKAPLEELIESLKERPRPKGEFVLIIGPPAKQQAFSDADITALLHERLTQLSVKDAVQEIASLTARPRKAVYQMALALTKES